jgi:hypothetical protein
LYLLKRGCHELMIETLFLKRSGVLCLVFHVQKASVS